jgi:hypothetical protein
VSLPAPAALSTSTSLAPSHSALEMADIPHGDPAVVATAFISLLRLPPHCIAEVICKFKMRQIKIIELPQIVENFIQKMEEVLKAYFMLLEFCF